MSDYKTIDSVTIENFGAGSPSLRESFTVPAGTAVEPVPGEPDAFWVSDISVIPEFSQHDAKYHGVRIPADKVDAPHPEATSFRP